MLTPQDFIKEFDTLPQETLFEAILRITKLPDEDASIFPFASEFMSSIPYRSLFEYFGNELQPLAVEIVINFIAKGYKVIYLDLCKRFNVDLFAGMLANKEMTFEEAEENISYFNIDNAGQFINTLNAIQITESLRLIVIDGYSAYFYHDRVMKGELNRRLFSVINRLLSNPPGVIVLFMNFPIWSQKDDRMRDHSPMKWINRMHARLLIEHVDGRIIVKSKQGEQKTFKANRQ